MKTKSILKFFFLDFSLIIIIEINSNIKYKEKNQRNLTKPPHQPLTINLRISIEVNNKC